jgi:hypothetical protein
MPTGTIEYSSRGSDAATKRADANEISCSADLPPKMSATVSIGG